MKCLITDKELNTLKALQDNLEEGLVSKKQAALALKYAIEDIEAKEFIERHEAEIWNGDGTVKKALVTGIYEVR